jgi:Flp pilus assembly protein TadD
MLPSRRRVAPVLALVLALAPVWAGCASIEGARLYHRGTAALDAGEPERAIADLERAASLVPQASEVQNHLGLAYAAAGRPGDAERAFRRAVELDCDNAAARQNLRAAESRSAEAKP